MRDTENAPRVFLYGRVSKDQQGGRSVNQQLAIGEKRATERGHRIVGRYADNDRSASEYARKQRHDWERLMGDIAAGLGDHLWVWEISRGTRERIVWANLVAECRRHQMHITIDDEDWDTTNPDHMRYLDRLMADAAAESGRTRKRILRDLAAAAEEGKPHGPLGYGYRREYDPQTKRFLRQVPDGEQAEVVREIARRYLGGEALRAIAADLNQRRIPTERGRVAGQTWTTTSGTTYTTHGWTTQILQSLLSRPALIGKRGYHGRIIDPEDAQSWVPILDEADWWTIREKLTNKQPQGIRGGRARWWLSGVAICDVCEGRVSSNGSTRGRVSYQCVGAYAGAPSGHVRRLAEVLQSHVETLLIAHFTRPDALEAFTTGMADEAEVQEAQAAIARLKDDLAALYREVEAGQVSRRTATADEKRIERELAELEATARPRSVEPAALQLADSDPEVVRATWREWDVDHKRNALRTLTREIRVLQVGKGTSRVVSPTESVRIRWTGE